MASSSTADDSSSAAGETRECQICLSAQVATRYHPCGHAVACELCTLQLIAKSPSLTKAESLVCPTCKTPINTIEKDAAEAAGTVAIARQQTFKLAAFDPMSVMEQGMAQGEAPANMSDVRSFIEAHRASPDAEVAAAAEAAAKAWAEGPVQQMPPQLRALQQQLRRTPPVPTHPAIRTLVGALTFLLVGTFVWTVAATAAVRADFYEYLASDDFSVKVTRVPQFEAPLNALIPSSRTLSAYELPVPTYHQRWWALMREQDGCEPEDDACQRSLADVVTGTHDIEQARRLVFWLVVTHGWMQLLTPMMAVLRNTPTVPGALKTGLGVTIDLALLCSLHTMYWDAAHGVVMVMFIPGWAILWSVVWMVVTMLSCLSFGRRVQQATNGFDPTAVRMCCLATCSCCYWTWFLYVPLLCFAWFFAWAFVDGVRAQALDSMTAVPFSNASAAPMPFDDASAASLGDAFDVAVRCAMICWALAYFVLPDLNKSLQRPRGAGGGAGAQLV